MTLDGINMLKKILEKVRYHVNRSFLDEIYARRFYHFKVSPIFSYSESPGMVKVKLELLNLLPEVIEYLPKGNVCVFAPHFDDEVLGCGGSMIKHQKENNDKISVIYVTDSNFRGRGKERKKESIEVMKAMGIDDYSFLDFPEKRSSATEKEVAIFVDILEKKRPETIYLPFFLDAHWDHQLCNKLLISAMKITRKKYRVFGYEIWSLLSPNVIVDITEEFEKKMEFISMYKSQLETCDYVNYTGGINKIRAKDLHAAKGKAEGFFNLSSKNYIALFQKAEPDKWDSPTN